MEKKEIFWIAIIDAVKALQNLQSCDEHVPLSEQTKISVQNTLEGICTDICSKFSIGK